LIRARKAGSPLIVIRPRKRAVVLEAVKVWPGRAQYAARLGDGSDILI
jgi:hypothetical protein